MLILPAIDLLDGACVGLYQGDYGRATEYSEDPVSVARRFAAAGAPWLHVVDLDGAREGRPVNDALVREVTRAVSVPVQVGGGIRDAEEAASCLASGVRRVVLGTAGVERPEELASVVARFGADRVAAALDVDEGRVRVDGWLREAAAPIADVLRRLSDAGVKTLLYTDVRRDGTLASPNVEAARRLVAAGWRVLVAGGVARPAHLDALREAGAAGAVVGTALYRGTMTLEEALEAAGHGGGAASC